MALEITKNAKEIPRGPLGTSLDNPLESQGVRGAEPPDHLVTEEISLGDFVLSGGEIAALSVLDAVVRLLPGALGDHDSAASDSFYEEELLSAPSYTRPPEYRGHGVPEVLLTGDHARIAAWRRAQAERLTRERRPELWTDYKG